MSKSGSCIQNTAKITIKPGKSPIPVALVLKKDRSITIRGNDSAMLLENFKLSPQKLKNVLFKEDVIYESRPDDFLKGNPLEKVIIVNVLDRLANTSRTVARYFSTTTNALLRELTSDNIIKLIGQHNYDTLFSALCSVINLESKVRGILSLLTAQEDSKESLCIQKKIEPSKIYEEKCCQTEENCMDLLFKLKDRKKKRIRRSQLSPYVVTEEPVKKQKRVVIYPKLKTNREIGNIVNEKGGNIQMQSGSSVELAAQTNEEVKPDPVIEPLPDIKHINMFYNEDSNCSIGNLSVLSSFSDETLLKNPNKLIENIDDHTKVTDSKTTTANLDPESIDTGKLNRDNWHKITLLDGSDIRIPVKPEDDFHIATPEILKCLPDKDRVKLLWYQAYIDWKYCLQKDSDGYMPIHMAVVNDDVDMLRRHCFVLRSRQHTLDVPAGDYTPLQMALRLQGTPNCGALVATLLRLGADPLLSDSELRSPAHLAAENSFEALQAVVTHCQKHARSILEDHEELWKVEYATKSDGDLSRILLDYVCNTFDEQGYTPLMVASRLGLHRSVELLLEASPTSVNTQTPNAGDTALYIAVGAACMHALDRGNKSKVADHFKTTINILVARGADASLENLSGSSVNDLLSENNVPELSLLVGNKITSTKFFGGKMPEDAKNCGAYMLENSAGEVSIKEVSDERKGRKEKGKGGVVGGVKNRKANVNKEISAKNVDGNISDGKHAIGQDHKTKPKPIVLENNEGVASGNKNFNIKNNKGISCGVRNVIVKKNEGLSGGVKNVNVKVNEKVISTNDVVSNNGDGKAVVGQDHKTKAKPIILENIELPKINAAFISSSDLKILKPQDKVEKITCNATSGSITNVSSSSSTIAMQGTSEFDDNSIKRIIKSGEKKIVILNYSHSSFVGNTQLGPNAVIVNTTKSVLKRKIMQEKLEPKKQKSNLNLTLDKNT